MRAYSRELRRKQLMEMVAPITETGCWIFMGGKYASGYGSFSLEGVKEYAHRTAYRLFVGEIPEGKIICHRCDVKTCVDPAHLYAGSHHENTMDIQRSLVSGRFMKSKVCEPLHGSP